MLTEIIISGFGGQGVLFIGKSLSYAALYQDKELSWLPSYGPEMRGGTASCSVCISDEPIGSPVVTEPDILIAMNAPSVDKFEASVKPGGYLFADSSLSDCKKNRDDINYFFIPAEKTAHENGLPGMANIVFLGKMIKECPEKFKGIDYDAVIRTFEKIIPPKKKALVEKNMAALKLGYTME